MYKRIEKILYNFYFLTVGALLVLVSITTVDVIARYLFNTALLDTVEISSIFLAAMISLAMGYTTYTGEQVKFDLVMEKFPYRISVFVEMTTTLISTIIFLLMSWQALKKAIYSFQAGEFTGTMEIPLWPMKFLFSFGCILTALALLSSFFLLVQKRIKSMQQEKRHDPLDES